MGSISSIYASNSIYQTAGTQQSGGLRSLMQQLSQALQGNNLPGAQQAYNSITQIPWLQNSQSTGSGSTFSQTLAQLGSDLSSGNINAAQNDFNSLQQQLQSIQAGGGAGGIGGHHHHHGSGAGEASNSSNSIFQQLLQSIDSTTNNSLITTNASSGVNLTV